MLRAPAKLPGAQQRKRAVRAFLERSRLPDWTHALIAPLGVAGFIGLWQLVVYAFSIPSYLLPPPSLVFSTMAHQWGVLSTNSLVTLKEALLGYAAALGIGIPLAVAMVVSPFVSRLLYPITVASQAVPKVALAPILLVWVGFGLLTKVVVAFLIAFFPIVVTTVAGLAAVEEDKIHLVRSMGASQLRVFFRIRFPSALPSMFSGFKLAIAEAVVGAVVGEFVGADAGLGYLLKSAIGAFQIPLSFAAVIMLTLMGIVLFYIVALIERLVAYWPVVGATTNVAAVTT